MTVYKGSQKNKDVYLGKTKIGKIYKGSQLLYTSLAYPLDTIVFEKTTAGTYNIALEKGKYEVYCIAGGAAPNVTASIISTTLNKAGNGGSHKSGSLSSASAAGGASVYNGYGAGGSGSAPTGSHPGSSGYVKIVYKGN